MPPSKEESSKASGKPADGKAKDAKAKEKETRKDTWRPTPIEERNPAKIYAGKANPNRDLAVFLVIVSVLFGFGIMNSDVGKSDKYKDPEELRKANTISSIKASLQEALDHRLKSLVLRLDCGLFLDKSSIPGARLALFAGKNYSKGELVTTTGMGELMPLLLKSGDESGLYVPPLAFLLNHHPSISNLDGGALWTKDPADVEGPVSYFASRDVRVGEELFVPYEIHPHSALPDVEVSALGAIPTPEDYQLADKMLLKLRKLLNAERAKTPKSLYGKILSGLTGASTALSMVNEPLAGLIPTTVVDLIAFTGRTSSMHYMLKNRTTVYIARNGLCMNDVGPDDNGVLRATRTIDNNGFIMPVPFQKIHVPDSETCSNDESSASCILEYPNCFGALARPRSELYCPLLPGTVKTARPARQKNIYAKLEGANAQLRPTYSLNSLFVLEAVATSKIEAGEEIVLFMGYDEDTVRPLLPMNAIRNLPLPSMGKEKAEETDE